MRSKTNIWLLILLPLLFTIASCDRTTDKGASSQSKSDNSSQNDAEAKTGSDNTAAEHVAFSIDGQFDEWAAIEPVVVDKRGDATGRFDLLSVWAQAADGHLYLSFELDKGTELNLQNGDRSDGTLELTIHEGNNSREIDFRRRQITARRAPQQVIPWGQVDFTCLPTYASNRYELQIQLAEEGSDISIEFAGSDSLGSAVTVPVSSTRSEKAVVSLARHADTDFRIANLNTLNSGLADEERSKAIFRLLAAADADVITMQEEWDPKAFYGSLRNLAAALGTKKWLNARWSGGCAVISQLPNEKLDLKLDRAAAGLVELKSGKYVVVISVHFKSGGHVGTDEDDLRTQHANQLIGAIKRIRIGEFGEKARDASVVVVGDYNLVGSRSPVDILNEAGFQDVMFKNPVTGTAYTWRDDSTTFPPSRLDWLCQLGAQSLGALVLNTNTLTEETLTKYKLERSDSNGTDHLMLIGDFNIEAP